MLFLLKSMVGGAQVYQLSDDLSSIKFVIKNLGFPVKGNFTGARGSINYSPTNLNGAIFNVTVDANRIFTGNSTRDEHLKKAEYFDVVKYPSINFVSKKVVAAPNGDQSLTGTLTIKGISKEIAIPFKVEPHPKGLLFKGAFHLNRRDFKVGGGNLVLSEDLSVDLSIVAIKS